MEKEDYLEHVLQLATANHQNKVAVAQAWQDALMKSLEGDTEFEASYQAFLDKYPTDSSVLEKSKPIKLSNPDKLARDYALLSGDSVNIKYTGENSESYNYLYKVRTKPTNRGVLRIMKDKKYGCVYVEFLNGDGGRDGRRYEMDEFTDFQKFMGLIVDVIYKF
jgi:hypothetical protein